MKFRQDHLNSTTGLSIAHDKTKLAKITPTVSYYVTVSDNKVSIIEITN